MIFYLTGQLAYLRGLDWFWIIIAGVFVFFLIAVSLHLIDWWRSKKNLNQPNDLSILPEENKELDKAEIILKAEHQIALGNLTAEHQKCYGRDDCNRIWRISGSGANLGHLQWFLRERHRFFSHR